MTVLQNTVLLQMKKKKQKKIKDEKTLVMDSDMESENETHWAGDLQVCQV